MKTLIFGYRGYLGSHFCRFLADAQVTDADIADTRGVASALDQHAPDIVLNCAGKTGRPNIDWCESHRAETLRANILGPLVLAEACQARNIFLVQISSGCIYEGNNDGSGYREPDPPNFQGSFYSRSKTSMEQLLGEFPVLLIRPRMPFDHSLHPRSLITKLIRYSRVLDVPNSITYLPTLLQATQQLIEARKTGIYNIVNPGVISPFDIMCRYRDQVDPDHACEAISAGQLDAEVRARRSNCQLNIEKLRAEGIQPIPIEQAVHAALTAIKEH